MKIEMAVDAGRRVNESPVSSRAMSGAWNHAMERLLAAGMTVPKSGRMARVNHAVLDMEIRATVGDCPVVPPKTTLRN